MGGCRGLNVDEERVERIAALLRLLVPPPGHLVELRALHVGRSRAVSSYYHLPRQAADMARQALRMESAGAKGVYWLPNPLATHLAGTTGAASDAHVLRRRWVLVDIDPERPADVASTAAEKAHALALARDVLAGLAAGGFGRPELGDSGNGYHLLYPVDLPNDDDSRYLVQAVLLGLAGQLDTPAARIDTSCYNAGRIVRLWGTLARKGESTPERPHRISRHLENLDDVVFA